LWGLGGAATGGLGSYLIGNAVAKHRRNAEVNGSKQASWYAMDDESGTNGSEALMDIQAKLYQDYSTTSQIKSEVLRLLQTLSPQQLSRVHSIVRSTAGAGIGFLLAKYLFGMGIGGSVLMGLLGGGLGMMSGGQSVNAFGMRTNVGTNPFGQSRLV
jgi:hypothetical protein